MGNSGDGFIAGILTFAKSAGKTGRRKGGGKHLASRNPEVELSDMTEGSKRDPSLRSG